MVEVKRLGSPIHSRAYFAFAIPKTVLSDADWDSLLDAARSDKNEFERLMLHYASSQRPVGGNWLNYVLGRFDADTINRLDFAQLTVIIQGFANVMDEIYRLEATLPSSTSSVGRKVETISRIALRQLRELDFGSVTDILKDLLENGTSLSWLVGSFVRAELLARDDTSDKQPLFLDEELNFARDKLESRIEDAISNENPSDLPQFAKFLLGARDLLGHQQVDDWIKAYLAVDVNFLSLLLEIRGTVYSYKTYRILRAENTAPYFEWESMRQRIEALSHSDDTEIRDNARKIELAIEQADLF
jgi:hypothetical protein